MLSIKAKENTMVDVVQGAFPLGQTNTLKIIFEDKLLREYLERISTSSCLPENNLYKYGNFNCDIQATEKMQLNINTNSSVDIVPGYGIDHSNCLHCYSQNTTEGLGICELYSSENLEIGKEYKIAFYVSHIQGTDISINVDDYVNIPIQFDDYSWYKIVYSFTATKEEFKLSINIPSIGDIYLDTLQLFLTEEEVYKDLQETLKFRVDILNPLQNVTCITDVMNYGIDEEGKAFVLLYVPSITTVDYQDNILCKLFIYYIQEPKNKILGNSFYNKVESCIYSSNEFLFNGYIITPQHDCYEFVIDNI